MTPWAWGLSCAFRKGCFVRLCARDAVVAILMVWSGSAVCMVPYAKFDLKEAP